MEIKPTEISEEHSYTNIISVVCPVYSGEHFLVELTEQIAHVRNKFTASSAPVTIGEAVFVIDEAIDKSEAVLRELQQQHDWINVITLSTGYGQHAATAAGILHTSGDWIVTLDEDLQHHPKYIPQLLAQAISRQADITYASPLQGPHNHFLRDGTSRLIKKMISWLTNNRHVSDFNSFRLIRGSIARAAASVMGHDGYYDVVLGWFTHRITVLKTEMKDIRVQQGEASGYTFKKLLSHARRMFVSSQTKVMRSIGMLGLLALMLSIGLGIYILQGVLMGDALNVRGWSSLAFLTLFFGSVTCMLFFVLFEYLSILTLHNQGKPTFYSVDRTADKQLLEHIDTLKTL
ncbi:MAG: glycosyltransferase [Gammaproteobacteria bacterium]|nr:glycosyltransferase [Gammaproteobacteria bacterium]